MYINKIIVLCMVLITTCPVLAQGVAGAGTFFASYPEDGSWFAMDESNTGFFFDMQDGQLAGAYFGFDGDGDNLWFIFNGELQPLFDLTTPDNQVGWQLETVLNQFANGGCILNCDGDSNPPVSSTEAANLFLRFNGRSRGEFSVNGSELVDIIPLYFGNPAIISEQTAGLTAQPDLEGVWVIAMGSSISAPNEPNADINLGESAGILEIGEQVTETFPIGVPPELFTQMITRAPIIRDTAGLFPDDSEIACEYVVDLRSDTEGLRVSCEINGGGLNIIGPTGGEFAFSPIQMMSDSRFLVYISSISDGITDVQSPIHRFEGFRLGYD